MGFEGLILGFASVITPTNLLACLVGCLLGTMTGVLPGLGPAAAMALLLPITLGMPVAASIIMLASIFYGAMYGGSTTSILLNVPGESASVVTCIDGHEMAKKGRGGAALAAAAISSFVAGTLSVVGVMLFAPPLARAALAFGPPEYFALALLGFLCLSNLSGDSFLRSMLMVVLGVATGTVGLDIVSGVPRFIFGIASISQGIDLIAILMGLFGMAEIVKCVSGREQVTEVINVKFRELYPTKKELKRCVMPTLRGAAIGFPVGILPGPGHILSSFISYKVEKSVSKHPEEFGKGAIEGVAGPEAANNAASTASLIPLLALGLPFTPGMAILIGAFVMHGISPSPMLITQHPEVFWAVVASMYVGNIALVILNLPLVGVFASLIKTPGYYLMPVVTSIMLIGAYAGYNSIQEIIILIIAGIIGYIMKAVGYSPIPFIIGMVLGSVYEESMVQGLLMTDGSFMGFFLRPISGTIMSLSVLTLLWGIFGKTITKFVKGRAKTQATI